MSVLRMRSITVQTVKHSPGDLKSQVWLDLVRKWRYKCSPGTKKLEGIGKKHGIKITAYVPETRTKKRNRLKDAEIVSRKYTILSTKMHM